MSIGGIRRHVDAHEPIDGDHRWHWRSQSLVRRTHIDMLIDMRQRQTHVTNSSMNNSTASDMCVVLGQLS
jgi:hypothetical protein